MSEFFPPINHPGLFSSPAWINAWVETWGNHPAITPVAPLSPNENYPRAAVGVWYSYTYSPLPLAKFKTFFNAGISTPVAASLRSEYFMPRGGDIQSMIISALHHSWAQLWIPDLLEHSAQFKDLQAVARKSGLELSVRDNAVSYAIDLQCDNFEGYLKSLSSNTRLKLFNKRKRLYATNSVEIKNIWPDVDGFIEILNGFHQERWGKPCYQGRNRDFIIACMNNVAADGGEVDLSVIYCNGIAVSAVFDINYRQRIYNIQSGFLEKFSDGISLGTLHFGFQIEKAFNSAAIIYDFMAGNGKNNNYKAALANMSETFVSVMLIRSKILRLLYLANDKIKNNKRSRVAN